MRTLDALQSRVREISSQGSETGAATAVAEPGPEPMRPSLMAPSAGPRRSARDAEALGLLRNGIREINTFTKLKDFPEFFVRFAAQTGLRLLLLKRWTSGLQVFLEQNIKLPAAAKKKGPDGRAPIPSRKGDIFQSIGEEAAVYCGPVPVKHFPLDLTLLLGRGSADRQIVILPLPSQNHWNTFLYLDTDRAEDDALALAEVLAEFSLARMCLLNKGVRAGQGRVAAILKSEIYRREKLQQMRSDHTLSWQDGPNPFISRNDDDDGDNDNEDSGEDLLFVHPPHVAQPPRVEAEPAVEVPELDPFEETPAPACIPLNPQGRESMDGVDEEPVASTPLPKDQPLTPELILNHSGELPALPKAAVHIMAVIEDPQTTATRLEKALAMDQTLTAKVLRIANSPFYGAVREIRTVSEAIVRLGFMTIRNWTVVTATKSVFLTPGAGVLYEKIWHQSVLSAMAGQLVGQTLHHVEPEGLFIGGLMQNIGQLILARCQPELFQEILAESESSGRPYHEVERALLGFDHGELGSLLIRDWNLSRDLEEAVRWHHDFENEEAKQPRRAAMIALGEEIAATGGGQEAGGEEQRSTADDEEEELPPLSAACRYLGVSHATLEQLTRQANALRIDPHFFN
ncbi:hypothetical protein CSA17_00635 [bacterium DOLJORAL78_65_58]|nr:MAG: hypothetical protein CSA17_00635 [bacterium DOLJORAL78_65_58]